MPDNRKPVSLLHTADLHIGSDIYPEEALKGLDAVLGLAQENRVDAILIAGDLFDAVRVSRETLTYTFERLEQADRPIVVLPGNHDTLLTGVPEHGLDPPGNVHILQGRNGQLLSVDGLSLTIWGRPVYEHVPEFKPLEGAHPRPDNGWYVVMAHGLVTGEVSTAGRSSLITRDELLQTDCDYIALGHVHRLWNVTSRGAPAFYSGAPSGTHTPTAVLVHMLPSNGVHVRPARL